jgi:2-polyprenyl-3-methyl-5-hydroxy-6-metoxy-1,4-benzoquinol methylase
MVNKIVPQDNWPAEWRESYQYDLQEIYDQIVHYGHVYAYQNRTRQTLDMVASVAPPKAHILDLAAAQGNFSLLLAEAGYHVTWNDLREGLVDYVKLKHSHGVLQFQPGNAFELNFDDLFDVVLITEVIEHVAHPDQFLQKVSGLVKPGGHIVMTTPNGEYFRNNLPRFSDCPDPSLFEAIQFKPNSDGHIFLLHQDEVERFARQNGLVLKQFRLFTTPLTNGFIKTEMFLKVLPRNVVDWLEQNSQKLPLALRRRLCVHMGAVFGKPEEE